MKCPHCNQEHPDGFQFCPTTGQKISILKACSNINCPDCGKCILPLDSLFCPRCGQRLTNDSIVDTDSMTMTYSDNGAYVINDECVACGTCYDVCPVGAISEGEKYSIDPDVCVICGSCFDVCPSGAIQESF